MTATSLQSRAATARGTCFTHATQGAHCPPSHERASRSHTFKPPVAVVVSLLSQLSGTVSVEHGGFTVTTSVDLRREIERGDAIIINGESAWQTMDSFAGGFTLRNLRCVQACR